MLVTTLLLLQVSAAQGGATPGQAYDGASRPAVAIPRLAAGITIDGVLSEAEWSQAARLTGFHQYQPVDGRAADEKTETRVFYSQDAIYFAVVASAKNPSSIRATIADRDNLGNDDRVTVYLDTFNDRRRAYFFIVNPLGAQGDGVRTEGAASAGNIFGGNVDKNPDFRFDSKGQVTDSGYVVEIRIPFKSLRFPTSEPQTWGINVVRNVAATGFEDTWTDARRATASFLSESGTLTGISKIERGITTEVQPFVTAQLNGARTSAGGFDRDDVNPDAGVNFKVAFPAITLDATVKPDFSQVESDAGLVSVNERFALFFAEKRPFFLEGIERLNTPNQLVYKRTIATPVAGAKVTGKFGPVSLAYLSALDNTRCPEVVGDILLPDRDCDKALFNIARLRRDFGGNSTMALTLTDRRAGDTTNTVIASDVRYVFGRMYYFETQGGVSHTRDERLFGTTKARMAPIWKAELDRTGRRWGFNYQFNGLDDEFVSRAGFVNRTGIINLRAFNRISFYGKPGARLESLVMFSGPSRIWLYDNFSLPDAYEGQESANLMFRFRGGWNASLNTSRNFFTFDQRTYGGLYVIGPADGLVPYVPPDDQLSGLMQTNVTVSTPTFQKFNASTTIARNQVPIFAEGSEGRETRVTGSLTLRPTRTIRGEGSLQFSQLDREVDGSEYARTTIPRLKVEYQPTRALFFRVVSQYQSQRTSGLRTPTGAQILLQTGSALSGGENGTLQTDWLVSYEPTPGTVAFFGYGDTRDGFLDDGTTTSKLTDLQRRSDGFFVKVAYQWRR
jgi:hypothetical protein